MNFEGQQESAPEKIEAAAIQYNEELFTGTCHAFAVVKMAEKYPDWNESGETLVEGFVTNSGRFVDREEAGKIAEQASQIEHLEEDEKDEALDRLDSDHLDLSEDEEHAA